MAQKFQNKFKAEKWKKKTTQSQRRSTDALKTGKAHTRETIQYALKMAAANFTFFTRSS